MQPLIVNSLSILHSTSTIIITWDNTIKLLIFTRAGGEIVGEISGYNIMVYINLDRK